MTASQILHPSLTENKTAYRKAFAAAQPFKHVDIPNFFDDGLVTRILKQFPSPPKEGMTTEFGIKQRKYACHDVCGIGPAFREIDEYIRGEGFQALMRDLTGIEGLLYDPEYHGAGTHENLGGQSMDPHIDFNLHRNTGYHRRINAIIYLNEEWEEEWGGSLQLHKNPWEPETDEIKTFLPLKNRCILFETNEYSWHGFEQIRHPTNPNISRKSFTIYMYTKDRPIEETGDRHSTIYVPRPLPSRMVPGYTLDKADIGELKDNFAKRDSMIKFMYRREKKQNNVLTSLKAYRENFRIPVEDFVRQIGAVSGVYGNFGVGKTMTGRFQVNRPVEGITYHFAVPAFIDSQEITILLDGKLVDIVDTASAVENKQSIMKGRIPHPMDRNQYVDLEIRFSKSKSPLEAGISMDKREVGAYLRRLIFE